MLAPRRSLPFVLALIALLAGFSLSLTGCDDGQESGSFQYLPIFGDLSNDTSPVLAEVNGIAITQLDLDQFIDEMKKAVRRRYEGPGGRKLALNDMVEKVLVIQAAVEKELYNDPDVARQLNALRRTTLESAMLNYGLLRGVEPTEEDMRAFFLENKDNYRVMGMVRARHIETESFEAADEAYSRLREGGHGNDFPTVLRDLHTNSDTAKQDGELGFYNRGGAIPFIRSSEVFTSIAFDLDDGLNAPFQVGDRWHVVENLNREPERAMTFGEAKSRIMVDMMPGFQDALFKDFILSSRAAADIEYFGEFKPGEGLQPEQLFRRAMAVADAQEKIDLLRLIRVDYPDDEKADDSLFMSAQIALDAWSDRRIAQRYLQMLLDDYPDSELVEDTKFLLENLHNPKVLNPTSIEDLRQ